MASKVIKLEGRGVLFLLMFGALLSLYAVYTVLPYYINALQMIEHFNHSEIINSFTEEDGDIYTKGRKLHKNEIAGLTCRLPHLDAFDGISSEFLSSDPVLCTAKKWKEVFATNLDSNLLIVGDPTEFGWFNCCYKISSPSPPEDDCAPIFDNLTVIPTEANLISVFCTEENNDDLKLVDMFLLAHNHGKGQKKVKVQDHVASRSEKLNVILLGLDSVSHMNLIRHMPESYQYIRTNLSAIEMEAYVNVAFETFPNLVPVLTGQSVQELKDECWPGTGSTFDECHFIWSDFASDGYFTSFFEDIARQGMFEYEKKGFSERPTDDYTRDIMNQIDRETGHSGVNGYPFCFGPRLGIEILLDHAKKTAHEMRKLDQPYFQLLWATAGFHERLDFPASGDDALLEALQWFSDEGHLANTALIFVSDHGQRYGKFRQTKQGGLEAKMPFLFFILPKWFIEKYPEAITNLEINRQRLSSPFDLHETLLDLLHHKENLVSPSDRKSGRRGRSHFSTIPWNRNCDDAGIDSTWCICDASDTSFQPLPIDHQLAKHGSEIVLYEINSFVSESKQCAKLHLNQILSADVLLKPDETESKEYKLLVMIQTKPGDGIFQATLLLNGTNWSFFGEISRVNSYGTQSSCVHLKLRNYCYCFDHN